MSLVYQVAGDGTGLFTAVLPPEAAVQEPVDAVAAPEAEAERLR